jgi:hypothetical protein
MTTKTKMVTDFINQTPERISGRFRNSKRIINKWLSDYMDYAAAVYVLAMPRTPYEKSLYPICGNWINEFYSLIDCYIDQCKKNEFCSNDAKTCIYWIDCSCMFVKIFHLLCARCGHVDPEERNYDDGSFLIDECRFSVEGLIKARFYPQNKKKYFYMEDVDDYISSMGFENNLQNPVSRSHRQGLSKEKRGTIKEVRLSFPVLRVVVKNPDNKDQDYFLKKTKPLYHRIWYGKPPNLHSDYTEKFVIMFGTIYYRFFWNLFHKDVFIESSNYNIDEVRIKDPMCLLSEYAYKIKYPKYYSNLKACSSNLLSKETKTATKQDNDHDYPAEDEIFSADELIVFVDRIIDTHIKYEITLMPLKLKNKSTSKKIERLINEVTDSAGCTPKLQEKTKEMFQYHSFLCYKSLSNFVEHFLIKKYRTRRPNFDLSILYELIPEIKKQSKNSMKDIIQCKIKELSYNRVIELLNDWKDMHPKYKYKNNDKLKELIVQSTSYDNNVWAKKINEKYDNK